jgi:hypothetical protein
MAHNGLLGFHWAVLVTAENQRGHEGNQESAHLCAQFVSKVQSWKAG